MKIRDIKELNEVENDRFKILVDKGEVVVVAKFNEPRIVCNWKEDCVDLGELSYFGFDVEIEESKKLIVVYDKADGNVITSASQSLFYTWEEMNKLLVRYKDRDDYIYTEIEIK